MCEKLLGTTQGLPISLLAADRTSCSRPLVRLSCVLSTVGGWLAHYLFSCSIPLPATQTTLRALTFVVCLSCPELVYKDTTPPPRTLLLSHAAGRRWSLDRDSVQC